MKKVKSIKNKLETSKKIAVWAIIFISVFTTACFICWYIFSSIPESLITPVFLFSSSVIGYYFGKAGFENVKKIQNNVIPVIENLTDKLSGTTETAKENQGEDTTEAVG